MPWTIRWTIPLRVDSVSSGIKIDSQIESAYHTNCLRDVLDTLSPEKMEFVQYDSWLDMTWSS